MIEVRAFGVVNRLQDQVEALYYLPDRILEDENAVADIEQHGFRLWFTTTMDEAATKVFLEETSYLAKMDLQELPDIAACEYWPTAQESAVKSVADSAADSRTQLSLSVPPDVKKISSGHAPIVLAMLFLASSTVSFVTAAKART